MFCAPGFVFGGTEGVGSRFHVLRARTHFRRYRGSWVPFSCFAPPKSFSAILGASGPFFMFCAPGIDFGDIEGVWPRFHVLRSRTRFWRYWGRRVPFYCFALLDSFSAVPKASGLVFMFCAPGLVFDGTEGIGSRFHVLRSRNHFRQNRGRRDPFLCFALLDSFRRYRRRRVPFSCFALPDSFSAVLRASGPIFMFCAPGIVLGGTEGFGSRFHVLRSRTHFRRYRRRRVPFACFALPKTFSAVRRASGPIFMFCAPGLIFSGTDGVGSRFHVLCSRIHFRWYRGRRVSFSCFAHLD
jgi:hypothetical protein